MDDLIGIGKVAESIEKGTREVRTFIYDIFGPSGKVIGKVLANYIEYQAENLFNVLKKTKEKIEDRGADNYEPPNPKFAIPLLEKASLEDDEYIQEMWAEMLVSSTEDNFKMYYIYILSELDKKSLEFLSYIRETGELITTKGLSNDWAALPFSPITPQETWAHTSPNMVELVSTKGVRLIIRDSDGITLNYEYVDFTMLDNLKRLNLIRIILTRDDADGIQFAALTHLGTGLLNRAESKANTPES